MSVSSQDLHNVTASQDLRVGTGSKAMSDWSQAHWPWLQCRVNGHALTPQAGLPQEAGDVGQTLRPLSSLGLDPVCEAEPPDWQGCWRVTREVTDVSSQPGCWEQDSYRAQQSPRPGTSSLVGVQSFLLSCSDLQEAIRKLSLGNSGRTS